MSAKIHITVNGMSIRHLRAQGGISAYPPDREEQASVLAQVALGHIQKCAEVIAMGDGRCWCGLGVRP